MTTSTLLVLLLASTLSVSVWLVRHRRQRNGSGAAAKQALGFCDCLLRVMSSLQQHRGLSSGWLAGDRAFEKRMMAKRLEIDALQAELAPFVAGETAQTRPCLTSNDLALFRFQWRTLIETLASGNVEQNIALHSHLIAQVLDWLASVGEARIELAAGGVLTPGLVRNYANRLPALSEYLGQARAIGSSVAARKGCSAVARVRLMFLISRAESLLEQACAGTDLGIAGEQAKLAVEQMAQTIRDKLLASAGIALNADTYFTIATRAVDSVLEWTRQCGFQIDRGLAAGAAPKPARFATPNGALAE
ncbi:MAG: hypothetical protein A3H93_08955 [Rhodocyclales bacterium RIFCSPLOWO2_02_FULL_63_24]|nr:MAG: hypothetical protein A3H93_08955 [Rhodocyclales bacterium RIFCSPLOWO2_02_FULL_63_24]